MKKKGSSQVNEQRVAANVKTMWNPIVQIGKTV